MTQILKNIGGCEIIKTNDKTDPFAVRLDGAIIVKSWSLELIEAIVDNAALVEIMEKAIEE